MNSIFGVPADTLLTLLLALLGLILAGVAFSALRHPLSFRLGLRNLARRKSQTALIVAGLALSTLIITSALGIGDTIDYTVKADVYENLGAIDEQIGTGAVDAPAGFSIGGSRPETGADENTWFDAAVATDVAALVDRTTIDAAAPAAIQSLPVFNTTTELSEAAVEIRGLGEVTGDGLALPAGFNALAEGDILVNQSLARELDAAEGDEILVVKGTPTPFAVAGIVPDGELAGSGPALLLPLASAQTFFGQEGQLTTIYVSNAGDAENGAAGTDAAIARLGSAAGDLTVNAVKADQLEAAAAGAEAITTLFITFGTFSIFSGILLIFLIFSVLAAERKSELGMSRAVGMQRADLIRQFISEGLAYNFVAAIAGAGLGVLATFLLAGSLEQLATGSLAISPRVSPRSLAIGFSLGLVITFLTVSLSAIRISQINIIAAIRDLNVPTPERLPQWTLFLRPFTIWRSAVSVAGKGNWRRALRLFIFAGPKAILSFWGGLLARGPVLMALGYLFAWVGVNVAEQSGVYGLGVSLFVVGAGQLLKWIGLPARATFSVTGLALVLYWSLPTREVGALAELNSNPGDFFISGMFLIGGAIILFLYNADTLLNLFAGVLGRFRGLLPVARVSIAYPVSAKGRTATTLAMFSLIIFTLVGTATITNTFSNFLNVETGSGGYDILVQANPFNPVDETTMAAAIDDRVATGEMPEPDAFAPAVFAPVQAQSADMRAPAGYAINGVDGRFLDTQNLELAGIASGYAGADAVWDALATDPTVVVIDNFSVDRTGDPTYQPDADAFAITSISASDTTFDPVTIEIAGRDGSVQPFTVIGVLGSAPSFYGAMMNAEAAAGLGFAEANRFFLRLPAGADTRSAANAIESAFSRSGLQLSLLKEQLEESRSVVTGVFYLLQGFIGLGLLIGIAALGVITIRAVVERRQQIGVLRAIGFQQRMIQSIFLFESLFIVALATLIGYGLALTFAYNLYRQVAADQGLAFLPPWPTLIAIGVAIGVASLLTAWLPARTTARVTIADALRFE